MNKYQKKRIEHLSKEPMANYNAISSFIQNFENETAIGLNYWEFNCLWSKVSKNIMNYFLKHPEKSSKNLYGILDACSYEPIQKSLQMSTNNLFVHLLADKASLEDDQPITRSPAGRTFRYLAGKEFYVFPNIKLSNQWFESQPFRPALITPLIIETIKVLRKGNAAFGSIIDINKSIYNSPKIMHKIIMLNKTNEIERLASLAFDLSIYKKQRKSSGYCKEAFVITSLRKADNKSKIVEKYEKELSWKTHKKAHMYRKTNILYRHIARTSLISAVWRLSAICGELDDWKIMFKKIPKPSKAMNAFFSKEKDINGWIEMAKNKVPEAIKRQYYFKKIIARKSDNPLNIYLKKIT